jgi:3'-5' exonuclease
MDTTFVYLDVETIPDQREGAADAAAARVKAPANYKDPEKIRAYVAEKGAEAHAQTSLNGAYGQLFAVGWAVADMPALNVARQRLDDLSDEAELLRNFYDLLSLDLRHVGASYGDAGEWRVVFVGLNVVRFDLRFLWQRTVVHGVKPSVRLPYNASPYSPQVVDLGMEWTGDHREYVSVDELCSALSIESPKVKHAMAGADVWGRVQSGDWQAVVDYNLSDVEVLRTLHKRFLRVR